MHIFLDESGSFVYTEEQNAWSTVCAIAIPDSALAEAEKALQDFKTENECPPDTELKLSKIKSELSFYRLIGRLERANCTLYAIATNAHSNVPTLVRAHKEATAQGLVANIEKMRYESGRQSVEHAADQVRGLSDQLYIQFTCQIKLMYHVISQSVPYYIQREPESLSTFIWRVDQKALEKKTEYEDAFEKLSPPFLQSFSISEPMLMISDFDHSPLAAYQFSDGEAPTYLKDEYNIDIDVGKSLNIQKIIREDIDFIDSKECFGIQIADLLSAGLRKCLKQEFADNLRAAAFIGRLMIQLPYDKYPLLLVSLGEQSVVNEQLAALIRMMRRQQRSMLKT